MTYQKLLGHQLLSAAEERHLIDKAQTGCEPSRERLILLNMRLVHWVCSKYETETVSTEDLIAVGVRGLMRAIEKMDTTRRTRLSTYATYWIHGFVGVSLLLESNVRLPMDKVRALGKVQRATATLHAQGTHEPSNTEIAAVIEDLHPKGSQNFGS